MKALWSLRSLFARQSGGLITALLLSLVTLAAGVALLGTSGWFLTAAALTTAGLAFNLFAPSALVRGFSFIRIVARYGEKLVGHDATLRLLADIRGWLFARLFPRLPLADRTLRHGDLVSRLTADVDALDTAFLIAIGPVAAALLIGGIMTAVLAVFIPGAAPIYGLSFALAILGIPGLLLLTGRSTGAAMVERSAEARMAVLDGIDGHADLVAFGVLGTAQRDFIARSAALAQSRRRLAALAAGASGLVQALAAIALLGVLWTGLSALSAGTVSGPILVGLLLAVVGSFEATAAIVRSVSRLSGAMAAAQRLVDIANAPIPVTDPTNPQPIPAQAALALDAVTFSYDGNAPALRDIDLRIEPGTRLAITGPSGSGKSTLLRLLLRLSDPQIGQITLSGLPLASLAQGDLHAHMALLSQDSRVFNGTIRNNLLIGRPEAQDADLWPVLAAAQIEDYVCALPRGLDTVLGEAGRTVSTGQARRLCLARTLLSPAPILLLDEPTNGLDREAELAFFDTLHTATLGRTVVLVTHADIPEGTVERIITMRNGRITA